MSRVALIGENSIAYVNALIDIWNNKDCAVLLDWRIPLEASLEMMVEADVHTCYIDKSLYNKTGQNIPFSIHFITYENSSNSAELLPDSIFRKFRENYSNEEAVVIYSSGTTGKSKGIVLSHFAISTNADAIIDYMNPSNKDCIYIAKSLSHASTLVGELLVALKKRMKLVIAPTIVPPRYILSNISRFHTTIVCLNPTLLAMIVDEYERNQYDLPYLKTIYVSGSILNEKVYNKAHVVLSPVPIYNVYGLSEAGPRVTAQRFNCCMSNSVGTPIKGVDVVIINEQGEVAANGELGIVHIKSPSIFKGYIVGKEKHNSLYGDWHNTGDVGYIDNHGELHIVSRMDDVIIINSHKIYPSELESQLIEQAEFRECAVTKVEFNNNEFIGCLYVSEKDINQDIGEKLKKRLLPYEIPRFFLKCDNLPVTKNGKVSTHEVLVRLKKYISQE